MHRFIVLVLLGFLLLGCSCFTNDTDEETKNQTQQDRMFGVIIGKQLLLKLNITSTCRRYRNDDATLLATYVIKPMIDSRYWEHYGYIKYEVTVSNNSEIVESITVRKQLTESEIIERALQSSTLLHLSKTSKVELFKIILDGMKFTKNRRVYLLSIYNTIK